MSTLGFVGAAKLGIRVLACTGICFCAVGCSLTHWVILINRDPVSYFCSPFGMSQTLSTAWLVPPNGTVAIEYEDQYEGTSPSGASELVRPTAAQLQQSQLSAGVSIIELRDMAGFRKFK